MYIFSTCSMLSKRNKSKKMDKKEILELSLTSNSSERINKLVEPVTNYIKLLGLFLADRKTGICGKVFQCCHRLYLAFIVLLLISIQMCFVASLFRAAFKLDILFLQRLGNTIMITQSIVSFCYLIRWQRGNNLRLVWSMLQKTTNYDGLKVYYKQLKFVQITSLSMVAIFIICRLLYSTEILKIYSFNFNEGKEFEIVVLYDQPYFNYLGLFGTFYLSSSWGLATFAYGFLCYCFLIEYRRMNKKFKCEFTVTQEVIDSYVKLYNSLREVVETANDIFSGYIFIMLFCNVCLVTIELYGTLMFSHVRPAQYIFIAVWLFCSLLQIWGLSWLPAMVNDEVRKLGELMYRSLYEQNIEPNSELFRTVTTFVLRNINYPIGIEAGGIFYMTKGLLLTVASLIITYLTLMIDSAADVGSGKLKKIFSYILSQNST